MDLWIRSQDRKELRPQPKLGIEKIVNGWCIIDRYNFYDSYSLGTYKSEERALEVLDEIQGKIKDLYALENCSLQKNSCIEQGLVMHDLNIYQMPEE